MKRAEIELDNNTQGNQSYIDLFASDDTKFDRLDPILNNDTILILFGDRALMSRLWTGFFGTESCRTPKIFQNPDFTLKRRDFWVFFVGGIGASPAGERKQVV